MMSIPFLKIYNEADIKAYTQSRKFETKLGERVATIDADKDISTAIANSKAKFVIVGVKENIGVKANGKFDLQTVAWKDFLHSFLNIQSNDFLDGEEVLLLGHFDFSAVETVIDINAHEGMEKVDAYRHAVNQVDAAVESIVNIITHAKKLPIVISNGHNNAYPCIQGAAKGWHKAGVLAVPQINAINLDANADYMAMEGRHAGNAFRYAEEDGFLEKYCVIGLQQNLIAQNVWLDMVNNPFVDCVTFEDIFVQEKRKFNEAVAHAAGFTDDDGVLCGIEVDLDAVQQLSCQASTAVGLTPKNVLQYLHYTASTCKPAYLHICGAAIKESGTAEGKTVGSLIALSAATFIKGILDTLKGIE